MSKYTMTKGDVAVAGADQLPLDQQAEVPMTKIIYNTTYGGFDLCPAAMNDFTTYKMEEAADTYAIDWRVMTDPNYPPNAWIEKRDPSVSERGEVIRWEYVSPEDLDRADPALVQAVENHPDTNPDLAIKTLAKGTRYIIREYDGMECVMTEADFDWKVA